MGDDVTSSPICFISYTYASTRAHRFLFPLGFFIPEVACPLYSTSSCRFADKSYLAFCWIS